MYPISVEENIVVADSSTQRTFISFIMLIQSPRLQPLKLRHINIVIKNANEDTQHEILTTWDCLEALATASPLSL